MRQYQEDLESDRRESEIYEKEKLDKLEKKREEERLEGDNERPEGDKERLERDKEERDMSCIRARQIFDQFTAPKRKREEEQIEAKVGFRGYPEGFT